MSVCMESMSILTISEWPHTFCAESAGSASVAAGRHPTQVDMRQAAAFWTESAEWKVTEKWMGNVGDAWKSVWVASRESQPPTPYRNHLCTYHSEATHPVVVACEVGDYMK